MINYFYDCYRILFKVYSEGSFVKQAVNSTDIEEKNRALTVKTCYGVLDKDIRLSYYISKLCPKSPKTAIRIILKIAMYNIEFLGKHGYAVIDNAVELVKKLGKSGASGFVNAVLRKFNTETPALPDEKEKNYLSVKYCYPEYAVDYLIKDYGKERAESIMSAEGGDTFVRFNIGEDGEKYLAERGVEYTKTPFENLYKCEKFVRDGFYDSGLYTFQSIGSVAICDNVEGGGVLLDACAAPGGKSVFLSDRFEKVVSCDVYEHRVELINSYKERMKKGNIEAMLCDSSKYLPEFKEAFDVVLCDVPCSGFGVVNDNPDIKILGRSKDVETLSALQLKILKNCSYYVKQGGYLYYSTCSIFFRENIENINAFMSDVNGFEQVDLTSPLPHMKLGGCLQFLPDISSGQGFFMAKFKRVK